MGQCPHTARKRRGALLNVLTAGRRGRRSKSWRGFGADPHSFAEFKKAINNARKGNTWYEWTGLVSGKDVRLKGYEKWLQIYVVDGVDYSTGMGIDTVREFNEALAKPFLDYFYSHEDAEPSSTFLTGGPKGRRAKSEKRPHREWIVELTRVSHDSATVVVQARDEEEAAELAEELAYSGDIDWEMRGSDQLDVSDVQLNRPYGSY